MAAAWICALGWFYFSVPFGTIAPRDGAGGKRGMLDAQSGPETMLALFKRRLQMKLACGLLTVALLVASVLMLRPDRSLATFFETFCGEDGHLDGAECAEYRAALLERVRAQLPTAVFRIACGVFGQVELAALVWCEALLEEMVLAATPRKETQELRRQRVAAVADLLPISSKDKESTPKAEGDGDRGDAELFAQERARTREVRETSARDCSCSLAYLCFRPPGTQPKTGYSVTGGGCEWRRIRTGSMLRA